MAANAIVEKERCWRATSYRRWEVAVWKDSESMEN